jgi:3-hydroxy-9,10-secoandrosta-1,3,5(10)-triene-9,17-dione monooxygenase
MWDWGGGNDLGLQASGSDTVEMHDAFVPDHYVIPDTWFGFDQTNGSYGTRLHGDPKYLGIIGRFFHGALVAPQIGAVRAALDEFEQVLRTTKNRMGPPVLQMQDRGFQTSFGLALALVDAAEMILRQCGDQFTEYCERWARTGQPYGPEDDTRLHAALQQAGRLTWRAMEQIWTAAPVDAAKRNAHLARYYRDVSMYRLHLSSRPLTLAPRLAELHFGLTRETLPGGPG